MDKIIKIAAGLFIIIIVLFGSIASYNAFVEKAYRESLKSSYSYTCNISTDSVLTNVTLFIPVPSDTAGNSPIIERFSVRGIEGIPPTWKTTLMGSNKGTYVEIKTPVISTVRNGTGNNENPIHLSLEIIAPRAVSTGSPQDTIALFRPVQDLTKTECIDGTGARTENGVCYNFVTPVYADYASSPDARVTINSEIVGRNEWRIFDPAKNEYRSSISVVMVGEQHGWTRANGFLKTGIGSYDTPALAQ
ncbi:MAG: hypothetical protein NTW33_12215 [Methanoregula sp.]|nr:hypothetical protein [Methanoregula sp.]